MQHFTKQYKDIEQRNQVSHITTYLPDLSMIGRVSYGLGSKYFLCVSVLSCFNNTIYMYMYIYTYIKMYVNEYECVTGFY